MIKVWQVSVSENPYHVTVTSEIRFCHCHIILLKKINFPYIRLGFLIHSCSLLVTVLYVFAHKNRPFQLLYSFIASAFHLLHSTSRIVLSCLSCVW